MTRIYEALAYDTPEACWWRDTTPPAAMPALENDHFTEIAIIGGGFTGLNAALSLAGAAARVTVIDAQQPGWGASGRNGGFCCLGGAKATGTQIARRYGADAAKVWHQTEQAAVAHVAALLNDAGLDADTHSQGETCLAHSPKAMQALVKDADTIRRTYGCEPELFTADALWQKGLNGAFHGGMTVPVGFALNPAKYHAGLVRTARMAGVQIFGETPALHLEQTEKGWRITTPKATLSATKVMIATNGYTSETVPDWLRGRYLPVQSTILVTRPITRSEQARQGWTSDQMCYDRRILLHYFRRMPDGRFLFGMRGGLRATEKSQRYLSRKIRADFHAMFPEWRDVEITHEWSGLVCLMRNLTPFAGAVPDRPGLYACLGYHGNGVAMGSYLGARLADRMLGRTPDGPFPGFLETIPKRFPLGKNRRALLAPAYAAARFLDGDIRFRRA